MIFEILALLDNSDYPIGAGYLKNYLYTKSLNVSEATAGRLLKEMDNLGYTVKEGNQGRKISPHGLTVLRDLQDKKWQGAWAEDYFDNYDITNKNYLIDLLIARRPVEIEAARIAAINATNADIEEMRSILDRYEEETRRGILSPCLDTQFHRKIALASKNQILVALLELLRKKQEDSVVFSIGRKKSGNICNPEHRWILDAIERHDPELAILAMKRHLKGIFNAIVDAEFPQ